MKQRRRNVLVRLAFLAAACVLVAPRLFACTGVTLKSQDGAVVFGRTLEWGSFDLDSRLVVVPRGYEYKSHLERGQLGKTWNTVYGAVGVDALQKDYLVDGMNEKGLSVNVFYHPGFAEYPKFDPAQAGNTLGSLDLCQFLLTTCATVDEAKQAVAAVNVVGVLEPALGIPAPIHLIVTDASGARFVLEFTKGEKKIHDAPLGVITNSPNYDWHETNLRNYLSLSAHSLPDVKLDDVTLKPFGGGSGMLGLPGDFTGPSRFVRAVAFAKTARPTDSGAETMYEIFRILDSCNVPLGSAEGEGAAKTKGMRSATLWTTAYDTKNLVMQYHTQHNRRVRQVDLQRLDFAAKDLLRLPLDKNKRQDVEDATPTK